MRSVASNKQQSGGPLQREPTLAAFVGAAPLPNLANAFVPAPPPGRSDKGRKLTSAMTAGCLTLSTQRQSKLCLGNAVAFGHDDCVADSVAGYCTKHDHWTLASKWAWAARRMLLSASELQHHKALA